MAGGSVIVRGIRRLATAVLACLLIAGLAGCRKSDDAPQGEPSESIIGPATAAASPMAKAISQTTTPGGALCLGPVDLFGSRWVAPGALKITTDNHDRQGIIWLPGQRKLFRYDSPPAVSEDGSTAVLLSEHQVRSVDLRSGAAKVWTLEYEGDLHNAGHYDLPEGWLSSDGRYLVLSLTRNGETYLVPIELETDRRGEPLLTRGYPRPIAWSPDGRQAVLAIIADPDSGSKVGAYALLDLRSGATSLATRSRSVSAHPAIRWTGSGVQVSDGDLSPSGAEVFCYDPVAGREPTPTGDYGLTMTRLDITRGESVTPVDLSAMLSEAWLEVTRQGAPPSLTGAIICIHPTWVPGEAHVWLEGYFGYEESHPGVSFYGAVDVRASTPTGSLHLIPVGLEVRVLAFSRDGSRAVLLKQLPAVGYSPGEEPAEEVRAACGVYSVDLATMTETCVYQGPVGQDWGLLQGVCVLTGNPALYTLDPETLAWTRIAGSAASVELMADGRLLIAGSGEVLAVGPDGSNPEVLCSIPLDDPRGWLIHAWPGGSDILVLTLRAMGRVPLSGEGSWSPVVEAEGGLLFSAGRGWSPDRSAVTLRGQGQSQTHEQYVFVVELDRGPDETGWGGPP